MQFEKNGFIPDNLKLISSKCGYSQKDLAAFFNVSDQSFSQYMKNTTKFPKTIIAGIEYLTGFTQSSLRNSLLTTIEIERITCKNIYGKKYNKQLNKEKKVEDIGPKIETKYLHLNDSALVEKLQEIEYRLSALEKKVYDKKLLP